MAQPLVTMAQAGVPQTFNPTETAAPQKKEQETPMTPREFRIYNSMAERMNLFHASFRRTWNLLHGSAVAGAFPPNTTLSSFITLGENFCHHLTFHHTVEERHIFPVLATRMPSFRETEALLEQHRVIHEGLEGLEGFLKGGFGGVLWKHLDEEVVELGAERMRRYWSEEEMAGLPM
ncbi:hypothetical protein EJ03DRAFT_346005 [Teratosphaeria nubilosa]|uniref:Hemerythrin-like domain-containing protein n=1 Tax=Teratosphaeria nubilosa TaxID=161662 RepID=A0A6G1KW95_9PEZI|nr:hypothetical protein EJ03DRAFT_346005 [Teratosphaeria nubilosa]